MPAETIVRTEKVVRTYRMGGTEVRALAGVDLEIYRGEYLSIMGLSMRSM
jgi:putative ABC transport system ATP-binding protein